LEAAVTLDGLAEVLGGVAVTVGEIAQLPG
jgi:hypothetical protein